MVIYVNEYSNIELSSYGWNKSYLVMMYYCLNVGLLFAYAADFWTRWVWTVWVHLHVDFFNSEYYSTTQQDPLQAESTNIEPQIWRKRSAEGWL